MDSSRYRFRVYILTILVLAGSGLLLAQLYDFQIRRQNEFRALVPTNYEVQIREPGIRGEIEDRTGVTLAKNERNYQLLFNLKEIHKDYLTQYWEMQENKGDIDPPSITEIIDTWVLPRLKEQNIDIRYNAKALKAHYKTHAGLVPYIFRDDLTYDQFAHFAEHALELPGVSGTVAPRRVYPYGSLASHVLGYLKQWEKGDVPPEFKHYTGDPKGISGIEATMNQYLVGGQGVKTILKNEKGRNLRVVDYRKPLEGSTIQLTIDARIQYLTERVLRNVGRAAAVVMDPRTGEVLAMASVPDFDPNDFIPRISAKRYASYRNNQAAPFLNRAISNFPPGSVFKIPAAIAGCIYGQHETICDCIGYTAYGKQKIRCWKKWGHGKLDLAQAIQQSCNPYFMQIANTIGIQPMVNTYEMLGMGQKSGIRLPQESEGILPGSTAWKHRKRGNVMTPALTGMLSIGQGDSEATPLQIATMISAVANKGRLYAPRIVKQVHHPDLGVQISDQPILRKNLMHQKLNALHLETIREGMYRAANEERGTAGRAKPDQVMIGAKTGTAQTTDLGVSTHVAWTAAFAPYENPRYVVVVAVKRGESGGKVAGSLVKLILTGIFAQENGVDVPLRSQQPYAGNTDFIAEISLPEKDLLQALLRTEEAPADPETSILVIPPEEESQDRLDFINNQTDPSLRETNIPRAIIVPE